MKISVEKQIANKKYYREHKKEICKKKRKQYLEKCMNKYNNLQK